MNVKLVYQDETSNKFWNIVVEGNKHTVTYGRVGTAGTSKSKEFADEAAALKDAEKLTNAKRKKDYQEESIKALFVRDSHTLAGKPVKAFKGTIDPATAVKVSSGYDEKVRILEKLDNLANQPNIAEMDTLIIGEWNEAGEGTSCDDVVGKLIELKDKLSGLKHLFIGDMSYEECEMSWIVQASYSDFYQHFPALETFGTRGSDGLKLGKINLPNLKNLIIESGGLPVEVVKDIVASNLNELEHLEIWLGTEGYGGTVSIEDIKPILNGNYPKLKYLGLKNYDDEDLIAKELQGASILKNLETLDLSMGVLKNKGAEALYNNDALLNLKHINCRHHFISDEWQAKLKTKFAAQNINLADQEDADEDDDEAYYYVEIGE